MAEDFDVIVVGTGAGGGTLAHAVPVFVDGRYISADTWYDGDGPREAPAGHPATASAPRR